MRIKEIGLYNVRNHASSKFELSDEIIFTGPNGSGKTTVLEALYFITAVRGFRKQPLSNLLKFGEEFLKIEAVFDESDIESSAKITYTDKKNLFKNETLVEKVSDHIFDHPIACHTPENYGVMSFQQSDRRSFLDRFVFYSDKTHINDLRSYNRLIMQKGAEISKDLPDKTYLNILNENIVKLSKIISEKRINIIASINAELENFYGEADFPIDPVLISYSSNINDYDLLDKEIYRKKCSYGVHRDRVDMTLDGKIIEKFSSFGQKKTLAILCVLAAAKHIEKLRKISIITLLDDFEAGLDLKRSSFLKEKLSFGRQAIYTGMENIRLGFENTIILQG